MKKSKHFRKDVIMARVIAGVLVIVLIVLLVLAVSILTKSSGNNKDTQNTHNTQSTENTQKEELDVDISTEYETESEFETESESEPESESESESDSVSTDKTYVITTSQIRLRKEPNTECATIELLEPDVKLEVLEKLDGWYKVSHNGQEGYVSATYVEVEES